MALIEDYALLGDLQTAALVERNGSIDWLCFPRFDSDACFAALLGTPENGRWLLAPASGGRPTRRYLHDTLVLETTWETPSGGVARVLDFMPPRGRAPDVVRIVEGVRGTVELRSELVIRYGYGKVVPWMRDLDGVLVATGGPDALSFRTPAHTFGEGFRTISELSVDEGERVPFVLTWFPSNEDPPEAIDAEQALKDTVEYWHGWGEGRTAELPEEWAGVVRRSLMVLKALTYAPTGGIVAAPTTSLPEQIGGVRNWDYRYCWLRDATLTLLALLQAGHEDEAHEWRRWLMRAVAGDPADIQIMYGVGGERRLSEFEVDWLDGYEGSRPVRVGNAASEQLQLDTYGELMDALYQAREHGMEMTDEAWELQLLLLEHLEQTWHEPDAGIWEIRGEPQHFVHSKAMAWLAFDRGIRSIEEQGLDGPVERWTAIRGEIHAEVCEQGFDEKLGSFTQVYGSHELDASLLLLPLVGFLPIADPRMRGTVDAVERELTEDGFLLRYRSRRQGVDGLPQGEGVFLPCSFWLVDCYEVLGRHDEALALFERLLALANDLDLLAEEYDTKEQRLLGNFPQAFTHLALVNAAFTVSPHLQSPMQKRHGL